MAMAIWGPGAPGSRKGQPVFQLACSFQGPRVGREGLRETDRPPRQARDSDLFLIEYLIITWWGAGAVPEPRIYFQVRAVSSWARVGPVDFTGYVRNLALRSELTAPHFSVPLSCSRAS